MSPRWKRWATSSWEGGKGRVDVGGMDDDVVGMAWFVPAALGRWESPAPRVTRRETRQPGRKAAHLGRRPVDEGGGYRPGQQASQQRGGGTSPHPCPHPPGSSNMFHVTCEHAMPPSLAGMMMNCSGSVTIVTQPSLALLAA